MKRPCTRRQAAATALAAATAATLSSCSQSTPPAPPKQVSIRRAPSYSADLFAIIRDILIAHKLDVKGRSVILKPNLVEFDPDTCINTHPAFILAALEAFKSLGAASLRIAEGPGHRRITLDLADAAGLFQTIPNFESLFTDLNLDEAQEVRFPKAVSRLTSLFLPKTFLAADLIVSLPKMKTHHWVGATLSMKNLFGIVPGAIYGWPKNILHWAGIDECIADLNSLPFHRFALVDGITGMEGNGPIQGSPKHAGVIVAGSDFAAVDATCCRAMGIDPAQLRYLQLASPGRQIRPEGVLTTGVPLSEIRSDFQLLQSLNHLRLAT